MRNRALMTDANLLAALLRDIAIVLAAVVYTIHTL